MQLSSTQGGHGPVFDLAFDKTSQNLIKEFYESGRPTASVCHGPAVFLNVVLSDGSHLIKGTAPQQACLPGCHTCRAGYRLHPRPELCPLAQGP